MGTCRRKNSVSRYAMADRDLYVMLAKRKAVTGGLDCLNSSLCAIRY